MSPNHLDDLAARQRWLAVLARSDRAQIEALLGPPSTLPGYTLLRGPETGLTMVRGRIGGTGAVFNVGEVPLTRCSVRQADGPVGHAYAIGRDHAHAVLAARLDAALQDEALSGMLGRRVIEPLAQRQAAAVAATAARAAATRVEFATLAGMR